MKEINNTDGVLDSRDIFKRIEELEQERDDFFEENEITPSEIGNPNNKKWVEWDESESNEELENLSKFMEEFKGYGEDENWRGDWYPLTIIHEDYFTEYTKELLENLGYIPKDFPSWISIDWEDTADNVKVDYTSAEFDGVTYWAR